MFKESASAAFKSMLFHRKMEFEGNTRTCKNYFKDGCSYPWCDMCGGYDPKEKSEDDDNR